MTAFDGRDLFDVRKPSVAEQRQMQAALDHKLLQETAEQLAERVYRDAQQKYEGKYLDRCTFVSQIQKRGSEVVFVHLLYDEKCGDVTHKMTAEQLDQLKLRIRQSRINEIKTSKYATLSLQKGVVQTYEYYLLPENMLILKTSISKDDLR